MRLSPLFLPKTFLLAVPQQFPVTYLLLHDLLLSVVVVAFQVHVLDVELVESLLLALAFVFWVGVVWSYVKSSVGLLLWLGFPKNLVLGRDLSKLALADFLSYLLSLVVFMEEVGLSDFVLLLLGLPMMIVL